MYYYSILIWALLLLIVIVLKIHRTGNQQVQRPIHILDFIRVIEFREHIIEVDIIDQPLNEDDDCCICLSKLTELDLEIADTIVKTKCSHCYHSSCLNMWINSDNELHLQCPLCLGDL